MPMNRSLYPSNWEEIRERVRHRADDRCEWCGVANHAYGARDRNDVWHDQASIDHMNSTDGEILFGGAYPKIIRIVCTTMHLDHDTRNNDPNNLRFACQRCHLRHDAAHHAINARETRRRKCGQLKLFEEMT